MNPNGQSDDSSPPPPSPDPGARPLGSSAKAGLILSGSAMIALCYLFSLAAMALLSILLAAELVVFLALLRFGMSRIITGVMAQHGELLTLFARSLWLPKTQSGQVPLNRQDAPQLFAILDSLAARLGIAVPRQVVVEMNCGAWVELHGWRQGSKATRLGIGYDLLAGLTEAEVEAVLAHEMVHARLVRRGLRTWLNGGIARIANLTSQLSMRQEAYRLAHENCSVGALSLTCADSCTRVAARLVAAYSRQDEFEADHGAAQLCGSASLRSALGKLHGLSLATVRLGWHERVAKLQQGGGYAAWLLTELATEGAAANQQPDEIITDPYATHPSIADRLTALPPADSPLPASPPAINLIVAPDTLADRIIGEIERLGVLAEARDARQLRRLARKIRSGASLRPLQLFAVVVIILAAIALSVVFVDGFQLYTVLAAVSGIGGGLWLYRFGGYRQTLSLAVPGFGQIHSGVERVHSYEDLGAEEKRVEASLKEAAGELRGKRLLAFYHERAFAALSACEYLEAHVAGRLGLAVDDKSIPCALALVVAAGSLRQSQLVAQSLHFLRQRTGIATVDVLWGAAWSLYLDEDWSTAEALLSELLKLRRDDITLHLLLSNCAANRGKRHTALVEARIALESAPASLDATKLLLDQLLDGGYLREALAMVERLPSVLLEDPSLRLARIRLHLLRGDFDAAHALEAPLLEEATADAALRLQLAAAHEGMRRHQRAGELYSEVVRIDHYPEAVLGLGRLASRLGQHEAARKHLLAALNTIRPAAAKAVPALNFFAAVTAELRAIRGPGMPCRAWIATFTSKAVAGPLANISFVIFARDETEAIAEMRVLTDAIIPGHLLQPTDTQFRLAPKDRQPAGAVVPGVQGVWSAP